MHTKRLIGIGLVLLVAVSLIATIAVRATAEPEQRDFASLDSKREAVDTSMNIYIPLLTAYSNEYVAALNDQRPAEQTDALRERYVTQLATEATSNTKLIDSMSSSLALRNESVDKAYTSFAASYTDVIEYYEQKTIDMTAISAAVAGPCSQVNNRNFASETVASDYVKSADICLKEISANKDGVSKEAAALLSSVETLFKERRDRFAEVETLDGIEQRAAQVTTLISFLDINTEVKAIQSTYEAADQAKITERAKKANTANEALARAIETAGKVIAQ